MILLSLKRNKSKVSNFFRSCKRYVQLNFVGMKNLLKMSFPLEYLVIRIIPRALATKTAYDNTKAVECSTVFHATHKQWNVFDSYFFIPSPSFVRSWVTCALLLIHNKPNHGPIDGYSVVSFLVVFNKYLVTLELKDVFWSISRKTRIFLIYVLNLDASSNSQRSWKHFTTKEPTIIQTS